MKTIKFLQEKLDLIREEICELSRPQFRKTGSQR